jgi:hypothetical protein
MRQAIKTALEDMAIEMESMHPHNTYRVEQCGNSLQLVERRGISILPDWLRPRYGVVRMQYNGGLEVTTNHDPWVDDMVLRYALELGFK